MIDLNRLISNFVNVVDLKSLPLAECQFESGRGHHLLKLFLVLFFFCLLQVNALSASSKTVKAIENCADFVWEKKQRAYRQTYDERMRVYEIGIKKAIRDERLVYADTLKKLKQNLEEKGKEEYNKLVVWEKTYIKKNLKEKLDYSSYEKYFMNCETERKGAPITFEEKWK